MAIESRVFERIGVHIRSDELERLIADAVDQMVPARVVEDPTHELTPEETAALRRGGVDPAWSLPGADNPVVRSAAQYAAMLASSLTVYHVARLLGVDQSRIRHRLAERTIYGIKTKSGWRIPSFQFAGSTLVPGIERVLPCLPPSLHPLAVVGWFTRPNSDLLADDLETPLSPLDWLRSGRDPAVACRLAASVGRGG